MNMQRISSRQTFFLKRLFPVFSVAIVAVSFLLVTTASLRSSKPVPIEVWIAPLFMLAVGYVLMRYLVLDLMDEVWDAGDRLIVKNRGEEAHIPLTDVVNVDFQWLTSPNRITLTLRQPCRFGKVVTFCPKGIYVFPFSKNPIAGDLVGRVEALRQQKPIIGH